MNAGNSIEADCTAETATIDATPATIDRDDKKIVDSDSDEEDDDDENFLASCGEVLDRDPFDI